MLQISLFVLLIHNFPPVSLRSEGSEKSVCVLRNCASLFGWPSTESQQVERFLLVV